MEIGVSILVMVAVGASMLLAVVAAGISAKRHTAEIVEADLQEVRFGMVENKERVTNARKHYYYLKVDGEHHLFTTKEMHIAKERAFKNEEDYKHLT